MESYGISEVDPDIDATVKIHESSYVDDEVRIGAGTSIWHFCHVMTESKIGKNCRIGQNVVIGPRAIIGNNVNKMFRLKHYHSTKDSLSFLLYL